MTLVIYGCLSSLGIVCSTLLAQSADFRHSPRSGTSPQHTTVAAPEGAPPNVDYRPIAASYSRYSSENQHESSIEDQQRISRDRADREGCQLPTEFEYADHAVSGTLLKRDGLDQLLQDAADRKFSVLIMFNLGRLARESIIGMPILKKLVYEYGIRIISVAQAIDSNNPSWKKLAMMYLMEHESFIEELSANVHRGQVGTILNGFGVGDHRFGYCSVPAAGGEVRGRGRNAKPRMSYQIHAEQAEWVQQIFTWYVTERRTVSWINGELNRRNAPKDHRATTPEWQPSQVTGVLTSTKYIGIWPWGVMKNKRIPSTGQVIQERQPESETSQWTRHIPEMRIISDDVFFAAQELRQKYVDQVGGKRAADGTLRGPIGSRNPQHLLAGLFRCQLCGATFHTTGARTQYMACSRYKSKTCTCSTSVPRRLAERLILETIGNLIKTDSAWLQKTIELTDAEIQAAAQQQPSRLISIVDELKSIEKKIGRLLDLAETSDDPGLGARLAERRKQKEDLQRELAQLQRKEHSLPRIPTAEWVEQQMSRLDQVLRSGTPAGTHALHNLLDGPIMMEAIPHVDRQRCHFRGTLRIRIGRLVVDRGSEIPEVQTASTGDADLVRELTIEFREPTKTEKQAAIAWEMHLADRPIKEIAKAMNVSRARMTAILKFAADERGVEWVDGRARRATLPDSTRPPTLGDQKSEQVMVLFHQDKLLGEIATLLAIDRNIVTAVVAKWHRQRGLPVPDGRTRRKRLTTKSSPPPTIGLDGDVPPTADDHAA